MTEAQSTAHSLREGTFETAQEYAEAAALLLKQEASIQQLQHDLNEQLHQVKAYDARAQQLEAALKLALDAMAIAERYVDVEGSEAEIEKFSDAIAAIKEQSK